jgi:hypothetical protein
MPGLISSNACVTWTARDLVKVLTSTSSLLLGEVAACLYVEVVRVRGRSRGLLGNAKNDLTLYEKRPEKLARQHHVCCEQGITV